MIISQEREVVVEVRKYLQASASGYLAVGGSSHCRSTEDSSALEQSQTSSSLRKECLDGEKEPDFGIGAENSCSFDGILCLYR